MKRKVKTILAGMLMLAMLVQMFTGAGIEAKADETPEKTYKELKFSDWGTSVSNLYANVFRLIDARSEVESLDGVAVSGMVNFHGIAGACIRFGGTEEFKHGGFAFIVHDDCLQVVPQFRDGATEGEPEEGTTNAQIIISTEEWTRLKDQDLKFRAAFDRDAKDGSWDITVKINDKSRGTFDCGTASPGLYMAYSKGGSPANINTVAQQVTVTDIDNTEMKFSDWGKLKEKNKYYTNVFGLIDARSEVDSLDGVAVNGIVNFRRSERAFIRIGGNNDHTGFAFIHLDDCLQVAPQFTYNDTVVEQEETNTEEQEETTTGTKVIINATDWETLRTRDNKFRAAFYEETDGNWYIAVYINDEFKGTYNCGAVNPGTSLAYSVDTTNQVQTVAVTDINREAKFSDWGTLISPNLHNTKVYQLMNVRSDITTLDQVAVSGMVNFHGIAGACIRIGGTEEFKHGGFTFISLDGRLQVLPQEIGGNAQAQIVIDTTKWATLENQELKFRAAFYRETDGNWYIAIYINDEFQGTYNCGAATPGLYMAYSVDKTTLEQQVATSDIAYTEMQFTDWERLLGYYDFDDYTTFCYAINFPYAITSLDNIAISGTVNYNEILKHPITVGGYENQRYVGFWLQATGERQWNLSARGIGKEADVTMSNNDAISYNQDVELTMTFDEVVANSWLVRVYAKDVNANDVYVGGKVFEDVSPGYIFVSISEDVNLKGIENEIDKHTIYELVDAENSSDVNSYQVDENTSYPIGDTHKDKDGNVTDPFINREEVNNDVAGQNSSRRVVVWKKGDTNVNAVCDIADVVRLNKYTKKLQRPITAAKLASDFEVDGSKDRKLTDDDTIQLCKYIFTLWK